jgi:hypothetical protein
MAEAADGSGRNSCRGGSHPRPRASCPTRPLPWHPRDTMTRCRAGTATGTAAVATSQLRTTGASPAGCLPNVLPAAPGRGPGVRRVRGGVAQVAAGETHGASRCGRCTRGGRRSSMRRPTRDHDLPSSSSRRHRRPAEHAKPLRVFDMRKVGLVNKGASVTVFGAARRSPWSRGLAGTASTWPWSCGRGRRPRGTGVCSEPSRPSRVAGTSRQADLHGVACRGLAHDRNRRMVGPR